MTAPIVITAWMPVKVLLIDRQVTYLDGNVTTNIINLTQVFDRIYSTWGGHLKGFDSYWETFLIWVWYNAIRFSSWGRADCFRG